MLDDKITTVVYEYQLTSQGQYYQPRYLCQEMHLAAAYQAM